VILPFSTTGTSRLREPIWLYLDRERALLKDENDVWRNRSMPTLSGTVKSTHRSQENGMKTTLKNGTYPFNIT
jgi:hypothetical protein